MWRFHSRSVDKLFVATIVVLAAARGTESAVMDIFDDSLNDRHIVPAHPIGARVANLKDQLEKGLRIRRPEEFAFIAQVVSLVESNQLPLKLVVETFHWSRRQDPHFPFPYFERAIRIRAARIGVTID